MYRYRTDIESDGSLFWPNPSHQQVNSLMHRFMDEMDTATVFGIREACYSLHRHPLEFRVATRHSNHVTISMSYRHDTLTAGPRVYEWIISGNFDGDRAVEWLQERHVEWHLMAGLEGQARLWL